MQKGIALATCMAIVMGLLTGCGKKNDLQIAASPDEVQKGRYVETELALPEEWKDGKISGLRAPGGITIDFAWKDRCITECSLQSQTDMVRILLYNGIEKEIMLKADTICHIV